MDRKLKESLSKEIEAMIDTARRNPLRYQDRPTVIDDVLDITLKNPEWGATQVDHAYQLMRRKSCPILITKFYYSYRIAKSDGRRRCSSDIVKYVGLFNTIFASKNIEESRKALLELHQLIYSASLSSFPASRQALRIIAENWKEQKSDNELCNLGFRLTLALSGIGLEFTKRLFNSLIQVTAETNGLIQRESLEENLDSILKNVDLATKEVEENPEEEPGEIAHLPQDSGELPSKNLFMAEEEAAGLRGTLFALRHELQMFKERLRELENASHDEAVVKLLSSMNGPENSYLLDNLMQSGRLFGKLLSEGWVPPVEIESVPYVLKMFADFIQRLGVENIKEVGINEKITYKDQGQIYYVGSEFKSQEEEKTVEFRTGGWQYRGNIISRPQAVEKK